MADLKLSALTEISVPALEDLLYTVDDPAGTPASAKVSANRLGGLLTRAAFGYRLTTESGVPVSTSDRTAQGTIYLTPDPASQFCRLISLYDGTRWKLYTNAEISLALTATSGKNYDVFVYDNAGTLTLELSAAWTNDTTRADALTTQDGIYVKSGATTRRYAGTIRASAANVTEDSEAKRFVWNAHNRADRVLLVYDTTDSWSYTTDSWRQARASSANQVEFVCGLAGESHIELSLNQMISGTSAVEIGFGLDSTSAADETHGTIGMNAAGTLQHVGGAFSWPASLGYHYVAWLERGATGGTFYGYQAGYRKSGLLGETQC